MRLKVPWIDSRTRLAALKQEVVDLDTDKVVGYLETRQGRTRSDSKGSGKGYSSRTVSLFDEKYRGTFESHGECVAFAMGVEAVLNNLSTNQAWQMASILERGGAI
jgi:hypothetical protein